MKNFLENIIRFSSQIIGKKRFEKLIVFFAKSIRLNLHVHGLIQMGALSSFNSSINGEELFIKHILPDLLTSSPNATFFDVGANIGDYSSMLRNYFPLAHIYSFEPVETTCALLQNNTKNKNVRCYNLGFSDQAGVGTLYNTISDTDNQIASVYKDVFKGVFYYSKEIEALKFTMETLDNFCINNQINGIDFLKIDVEGHELSVLKGAFNLLKEDKVKVVQFEFNSHNIFSKVFLKDFYLVLENFEFFRLVSTGMMILGSHNVQNEIFTAQNIIAVHKIISSRLNKEYLFSL